VGRTTLVTPSDVQQYDHWGVRVSEAEDDNTVPAFSVDDLMRTHKLSFIDILKLDIEGSELEVLATYPNWISRIGMLAIETHDRFRPGCRQVFECAGRDFPVRFTQGEIEFAFRQAAQSAA
jgi:hypothetical protein